MKWYVWVLNSWLVGLFIITAGLNFLLKQKPPRAKKTKTSSYDANSQSSVSINLEKIYQNDLFDTYKVVESEPSQKELKKEEEEKKDEKSDKEFPDLKE